MSLEAIKELAAWVKAHHGGDAELLADAAQAESPALEDAASEIAAWAAGNSNNGAGPTKTVALMESIAKEAK